MKTVTILGLIAAVLTTSSSLPQLYKTIRTKSAHDVSEAMFLLVFVGNLFWLVYGIMSASAPIFGSAIAAMTIIGLNLYYTYKFR